MIVAGQDPYPFDNTVGAGRLRLPVNGFSWWGKVSVGNGDVVEIPLNVTRTSANNLDGAIWWPETTSNHNDIDLSFCYPSRYCRLNAAIHINISHLSASLF